MIDLAPVFRKRILPAVAGICILLAFVLTLEALSPSAYRACRDVMQNADGYGVWKLQSRRPQLFSVEFDFYDGYNTATCKAVGIGPHWVGSKQMETVVACMLALTDTGGTECPRGTFGVSP